MKNNSYRILKLKSGEELITRIKGQKNGKIIIERPMIFKSSTMTDPHGRAREVTVLKNWLSYSNHEQTSIPKDFVATYLKPDIDVMKLYDFEKKKDDHLKSQSQKKNKIVKKDPRGPKNFKNINNFDDNFEGKDNIEGLINFLNQFGAEKNKSMMEKIIEDIENLNDEELEELRKEAHEEKESNDNYMNYITMTLFVPPDALLSLIDIGLFEEDEIREVIEGIKKQINPPSWKDINNLFNEYEKRDPNSDDYGNDYRDWSPYTNDY